MRLLCVLCLFGSFIPDLSASERRSQEFPSVGLSVITIENGSGSTDCTVHDEKQVAVEVDIVSGTEKDCQIEMRKNGSGVLVKVLPLTSGTFFSSHRCVANVRVKAPHTLNLNVSDGSGNVHLTGFSSKLNLKVGSGNITVKGSPGDTNVSLGSGNAELSYLNLPREGKLQVQIGSGNLDVFFPKGSSVQSHVKMGSGTKVVELDAPSSGSFLVEGKIGSGNLRLKNTQE